MGIAVAMLESAAGKGPIARGSRIITLVGGPITHGPGKIVAQTKKQMIRSHLDIQKEKENTQFMKPAIKYFQSLADRAQRVGIVMDIFAADVDQVGTLEMKPCLEQTGGFYVMTDSFANPVFKESFKKFFEVDETGELKMGFVSKISATCCKELKISGAIGQLTSLKQKSSYSAETEIGIGGTNSWYLGGMDRTKTLAFYFEIFNTGQVPQHHKVHIQFQTYYQHVNGSKRLRVTTAQRIMTDIVNLSELAYGFDQETAAVLTSREAIFKTFTEDSMDVIRWLDRSLIKLVSKFAEYRKDDVKSFKLSKEFSLYPQFMFYLRRSQQFL